MTETDKLEMFREKGFLQAPIVVADGQEWFGFRPDLIDGLATGGKMEAATTEGAPA